MTTLSLKQNENGARTSIGTNCEIEIRDAEGVVFVMSSGEKLRVTEYDGAFHVEYGRFEGVGPKRLQELRFKNGEITRIEKV